VVAYLKKFLRNTTAGIMEAIQTALIMNDSIFIAGKNLMSDRNKKMSSAVRV